MGGACVGSGHCNSSPGRASLQACTSVCTSRSRRPNVAPGSDILYSTVVYATILSSATLESGHLSMCLALIVAGSESVRGSCDAPQAKATKWERALFCPYGRRVCRCIQHLRLLLDEWHFGEASPSQHAPSRAETICEQLCCSNLLQSNISGESGQTRSGFANAPR